jgi:hypothetical protein
MESSFVRWNSLQAATPWFRKRDLQGNKTEERDQMDTRGNPRSRTECRADSYRVAV